MAETVDFTNVQGMTAVFLIMYREDNYKKLPNYA